MELKATVYDNKMDYRTLRIMMRVKRDALRLIRYNPGRYTSIKRKEKSHFDRFTNLGNYSEGFAQEILDPRSSQQIGHYFNARFIYILHDVIVEPRQGLVYDDSGLLISESTNWSTSNLYESFPWNPSRIAKEIRSPLVINLTSNAFGHWLVEDLGSILHLVEEYPSAKILVDKNRSRFVSELLEFLDREFIEADGPVKVSNLLMISKENDSGWMHPRDLESLTRFSEKITPGLSDGPSKVYATRRSLRRSPVNEDQIEEVFKSHNFSILKLEEINFISEIALMKNVKHIAGVSGSWQFNSIWMPEASVMIDIVNENYWTELAHRVCDMKSIKYEPLLYFGSFDSEVDVGKLGSMLDKL